MKSKILAVLAILILAMPMLASAQPTSCLLRHPITDIDPVCVSGITVSESNTPAWGMCCIMDAVKTVIDWFFIVIILIVALLIIWGGFTLASAGGSEEKIKKGKDYITWALIGLAVALLSRALPSLVKAVLGVK